MMLKIAYKDTRILKSTSDFLILNMEKCPLITKLFLEKYLLLISQKLQENLGTSAWSLKNDQWTRLINGMSKTWYINLTSRIGNETNRCQMIPHVLTNHQKECWVEARCVLKEKHQRSNRSSYITKVIHEGPSYTGDELRFWP